jgi:hypothetical protein
MEKALKTPCKEDHGDKKKVMQQPQFYKVRRTRHRKACKLFIANY